MDTAAIKSGTVTGPELWGGAGTTQRPLPVGFGDAELELCHEHARDEVRKIVVDGDTNDGRNPYPILLWGPTGTGKSYVAALMHSHYEGSSVFVRANRFIQDIITCRSSRFKTVSQRYQGGDPQYFGEAYDRSEKQIWNMALRSDSLWVIDELMLDNPTATARDVIYTLVDLRQGKPTIITCNRDLAGIASKAMYDDRVASRISCGTQIHVGGDDRRKANGGRR